MCVVSMIHDDWNRRFPDNYPGWFPAPNEPPRVSKEEFDKLVKEVEALKELIKAAKKYDEETGQPHCESEEKLELLRKIAELIGVDIRDI